MVHVWIEVQVVLKRRHATEHRRNQIWVVVERAVEPLRLLRLARKDRCSSNSNRLVEATILGRGGVK